MSTIHNDNVPSNIIVCPWLMDAVVGFCECNFCGHHCRVRSHTHTTNLPLKSLLMRWGTSIEYTTIICIQIIVDSVSLLSFRWPKQKERKKIVEEKESETERCLAQQRNYYYYKKLSQFHITCIRTSRALHPHEKQIKTKKICPKTHLIRTHILILGLSSFPRSAVRVREPRKDKT